MPMESLVVSTMYSVHSKPACAFAVWYTVLNLYPFCIYIYMMQMIILM